MKTPPATPVRAAAFTLVELLTVIAIIAVLMGLLFPAIGIIKEQARKVQAKTDVTNIVAAVKQYYTDYGKYPPVDPTVSADADTLIGDSVSGAKTDNNVLFDILRSIGNTVNKDFVMNPRKVVYFEAKAVSDPANPRAGFSDASTSPKLGCFWDPWGKQYNIVLDTNYDNTITLDDQYTDFGKTNAPRVGCGAFSLGKDNKLGNAGDKMYRNGTTPSDDVISWQ